MPRIHIGSETYQGLVAAANPRAANQPETVPHAAYDTQTYVDNSTTELTFFAASNSDRSLSNMEAGGAFPDPQFFALHYLYVDALNKATGVPYVTTAAGDVPGTLNDVGSLLYTSRPRLTFTMSDKRYGPYPLSVFRGSGAVTGGGWGTFTAEESLQWAHNIVTPDGGFSFDGAIIIPPKVGFGIVINWPAACNLVNDYYIRLTMVGVLSRRIS